MRQSIHGDVFTDFSETNLQKRTCDPLEQL